jgi:hypothetical protein
VAAVAQPPGAALGRLTRARRGAARRRVWPSGPPSHRRRLTRRCEAGGVGHVAADPRRAAACPVAHGDGTGVHAARSSAPGGRGAGAQAQPYGLRRTTAASVVCAAPPRERIISTSSVLNGLEMRRAGRPRPAASASPPPASPPPWRRRRTALRTAASGDRWWSPPPSLSEHEEEEEEPTDDVGVACQPCVG